MNIKPVFAFHPWHQDYRLHMARVVLLHNHTLGTRIHFAKKNIDTIFLAQGNMSALFYGQGNMSRNWSSHRSSSGVILYKTIEIYNSWWEIGIRFAKQFEQQYQAGVQMLESKNRMVDAQAESILSQIRWLLEMNKIQKKHKNTSDRSEVFREVF